MNDTQTTVHLTHKTSNPNSIGRSIGSVSLPDAATIPPERLPVLVTGASGVTGFNAFHYLSQRYPGQVFGQRPIETYKLVGDGILSFNLEDQATTLKNLEKHGIRSVLSCGGNCALKACELDPAMAQKVNVGGITSLLAGINHRSTRSKIRLVHLSVDMVFSGSGARVYSENDQPDPVTVYGKTMVESESCVRRLNSESCILRISLPMGVSFNKHAGAVDWIQSRFVAGRPATLYYDEVRTPTYVQCLNQLFEFMLAEDLNGLFHAGGKRQVSLFEIAQVINRVGGYDPKLLKGCYRVEAGPIPPRAGSVVMNCKKLNEALESHPSWRSNRDSPLLQWPYNDSHMPCDRNWHFDRSNCSDSLGGGSFAKIIEILYQRSENSKLESVV